MHTFFTRANAISAYALSILGCVTFCCFLSTVFIDYRAYATLNTVKVVVKNFNQVILWDKIVLRGDKAALDFKNMNTKYYFWDDGNGLRGNKNVTLTLSWNIIPNAGLLPSVNAFGFHTFEFPSEYTSLRV
nr:signal peptidase complex subunit 3 [Megalopta genalis]